MRVNKHDHISAYDVDGTLVVVAHVETNDTILITDPYTGTIKLRRPYLPHIELMKKHKAQGYWIKVWSHGGSLWAEAVVNALGIRDLVDEVEAKPTKIVDDLSVADGIGHTIFVNED